MTAAWATVSLFTGTPTREGTSNTWQYTLAQQLTALGDPSYPLLRYGTGFYPGVGLGLGLYGGLDSYTALAASQVAATVPVPARPPIESIASALEKARERLRVAQSHAVYEDGQIVAVVYEEKKEK